MSKPRIRLTQEQGRICVHAILDKLTEKGCEVIAIAVGGNHVHCQLRAESGNIKRLVGLAKQYASHRLRNELPGQIWGDGCHVTPIRTKAHQIRVLSYIVEHRNEGASVWSVNDRASKAKRLESRSPQGGQERRS